MKKIILSLLLVSTTLFSQVGIGTTSPNSQLDIVATSQASPSVKDGILIPRINNFPATNPTANQDSMIVFVTGNGTPKRGFYYWSNSTTSWKPFVRKIDDLEDGKSDTNGSSVFLGVGAGLNDDGTNNRNVGVGFNTFFNNTSGFYNTATGYQSLYKNTTGSINTATGFQTLYSNTTGNYNTATGYQALYNNTSGFYNTANGYKSLFNNTTGKGNIANGYLSMFKNTTGYYNTAYGHQALRSNTTGYTNTAYGHQALYNNTTGRINIAIGYQALYSNTTGYYNTAIGYQTLNKNTTGYYNIANGFRSLKNNTTGNTNTAYSLFALYNNTTGTNNTALGYKSLNDNTTGSFNTAIGRSPLNSNISGTLNVALGYQSSNNLTTGSKNVSIGSQSMANLISGDNNTALGQQAFSSALNSSFSNSTALGATSSITASNQIRIGNNTVSDIGGQVGWTTVSDARFKKNINEDIKGLNFIMKLRPVTYHIDISEINHFLKSPDLGNKNKEYLKAKAAKENEVQSGFIAQEVEQAAKDLGYEFSGVSKPKNENDYYGLRYGQFVVPLVKGMQEQQKMIEDLKKENKLLQKNYQDKIEELQTELQKIKELIKSKL